MSRVTLIEAEQAPLPVRSYFAKGDPGPITASLAHVPELLKAAAPLFGAVFGPSSIDARTKEIVVLRASALLQCRYCTQTHTAMALDAGLTKEEVVALRGPEPAEATFEAPKERALVAWVQTLADGAAAISDEAVDGIREHFSEAEVVELTMLAGATIMLNRYCTAFDLPASESTQEKLTAEGLV